MKSKTEKLELQQHELFEKAQRRISQKKRLYYHFILFVLGNAFAWLIHFFGYAQQNEPFTDWHIYLLFFWGFFFLLHLVNVFITQPFLGKDWERKQREKLVNLQKQRIEEIRQEVENQLVQVEEPSQKNQ